MSVVALESRRRRWLALWRPVIVGALAGALVLWAALLWFDQTPFPDRLDALALPMYLTVGLIEALALRAGFRADVHRVAGRWLVATALAIAGAWLLAWGSWIALVLAWVFFGPGLE